MANEGVSKKRRVRRDGSAIEVVEGKKYRLCIYVGRTETGKRSYFKQTFRGTSSQAERRLRDLATQIDNGIIPTRIVPEPEPEPAVAPVLLGETLDRWLKHKSSNHKAREGSPLLWRNLGQRHLKPLLSASGISADGFSLYSLRHTAASLLIAAGENIRVIAERLGTSVAMIDITYSHVPRTLQQTASDRLARVLHGR